MHHALIERLASIVPFRYLSRTALESFARDSSLERFARGDCLIRQGDTASDAVFVLLSGSVESIDVARTPPFRMNVINSGSYFGERSCLLGGPRHLEVRALEDCEALAVPGERFLRLLAESRSFAQGFGTKLREGLGLFDAFDRFNAEVLGCVAAGHIEIRRLVELYKALDPALHPLASDEGRIDWDALAYAVRRLPENVTRCFVFLLTDNLPTVYAKVELLFPFVATEARHRFVYEMMSGKDMVLVRDGLSDLIDFVTCLCLFAVEARKIRYRLNHPDLILGLARQDSGAARDGADGLEGLPFDAAERVELRKLWPTDTCERVREIVFHRQAYSVDIRKQVNNYNSRLAELWASEVGEAAEALVGSRPSDFPPELEVHLVSSNTHSISNCLSPYLPSMRGEIVSWAESHGLRIPGWTDPDDELYHLARPWLEAFPDRRREAAQAESEAGIARLPETVTTGIQVQLVDLSKAKLASAVAPAILVNIDYAFGEQAEEIMRCLLLLFGRNVRSINVVGKAGSLVGARGDVLLPTAFIEQADDAFRPLTRSEEEEGAAARLATALPGRGIHRGPLLTVGGTLLQNKAMLQFYRRIWGCVGIEMEGIWYLRAILEAEALGLLRPGARSRFIYYVSDLPLEAGQRLSERMGPLEGIPPLYAVTREVLRGIGRAGRAPR
jgi:hypothetical protein